MNLNMTEIPLIKQGDVLPRALGTQAAVTSEEMRAPSTPSINKEGLPQSIGVWQAQLSSAPVTQIRDSSAIPFQYLPFK